MKKFIIFSDTACDLSKELRDKYDIEFINGHISVHGVEHVADCAFNFATKEEFFKDLKKYPNEYTTAPASPDELKAKWETYLKDGYDIIATSLSGGLSATINFMNLAKKELLEIYPERRIECIDSLRYSTALGLLTVKAAILKQEGKSFDEVVTWLNANKNRLHQMGYLDDLSFVAAKGRISKPKAFMGQLIGIKPLGDFDSTGKTTILGKVKGDKVAIETIIKYMEKTIENPEDQIIFVASTNRDKQALELKQRIEERFNPKEVLLTTVYPICSINIGPGLMAAYYFGTPISDDLEAEKKIMDEIINQ